MQVYQFISKFSLFNLFTFHQRKDYKFDETPHYENKLTVKNIKFHQDRWGKCIKV